MDSLISSHKEPQEANPAWGGEMGAAWDGEGGQLGAVRGAAWDCERGAGLSLHPSQAEMRAHEVRADSNLCPST